MRVHSGLMLKPAEIGGHHRIGDLPKLEILEDKLFAAGVTSSAISSPRR
jgi:hypothetical protein